MSYFVQNLKRKTFKSSSATEMGSQEWRNGQFTFFCKIVSLSIGLQQSDKFCTKKAASSPDDRLLLWLVLISDALQMLEQVSCLRLCPRRTTTVELTKEAE